MSWFSRRQPKAPKPAGLAPPGLATGPHRSPGLAILSAELEKRPPRSILDLGASSTETVRFLSRFCDNIHVQDLFHSSETRSGARSTIFRFDAEALEALSEVEEALDEKGEPGRIPDLREELFETTTTSIDPSTTTTSAPAQVETTDEPVADAVSTTTTVASIRGRAPEGESCG